MSNRKDITFLIAGESTTRKSVKGILEGNGFRGLFEASNGNDAVRLCKELRPDMAILVDGAPLLDDLAATRLIRSNQPQTKVIIITVNAAGPHLLESLTVGASAYITKNKAACCLLQAVTAVSDGDIYVRVASRDCVPALVSPVPQILGDWTVSAQEALRLRNGDKVRVILTRRQQEVLGGVLRMLANKEIACELNLTERTVKFHVASLLTKFNVRGRLDLIRQASMHPMKFPPQVVSSAAELRT